MTRFFSRGLALLGRLYRLEGGQVNISQLDMRTPIQLVHDVSRTLELDSFSAGKFGGYWEMNLLNTHAIADTQDSTTSALSLGNGSVIDAAQQWSWMLKLGFQADTNSALSSVKVDCWIPELQRNAGYGITTSGSYLLAFLTGFTGVPATPATPLDNLGFNLTTTALPQTIQLSSLPFPMPGATGIRMRSVSTAAAIVRMNALMWTGPIGVYPPGLR